jgi:hypothetical protein
LFLLVLNVFLSLGQVYVLQRVATPADVPVLRLRQAFCLVAVGCCKLECYHNVLLVAPILAFCLNAAPFY